MFTDMVGYTALAQKDEALSLSVVDDQNRLIRPIIGRHNGREVKTMGDAFLVEFQSALDAVRCAYDIQRAVREFNFAVPEERRLRLRIGVHLGDVIESTGDITGDAVNVASRIQPLAEEGGVCLTRQVYDQVYNKFELPLVSIGPRQLKNVSAPLEVYRVLMPWEGAEAPEGAPRLDRRRIAVLPFANISPDPGDEYFADGMTEEVIATMSRISGLKVIARTSVMGYKGGQKKIQDVAKELGVGSVLEGSVRKAGERARITIQLIDAETSEHTWAESYDRELRDVFAIQSDIAKTVAEALRVQLLSSEKAIIEKQQKVNPEAFTLYLKGRHFWNERTKENVNTAIRYFEEAVKKDPGFALAYSGLADCYNVLANYAWILPTRAAPLAKKYASMALELDDSLAEAHASLGNTLIEQFWDFDNGGRELKRSIQLRPNYAPAFHWLSLLQVYLRRHQEALELEGKALELDPHSRVINMGMGMLLSDLGDHEQAKVRLERLIEQNPGFASAYFWKPFVHLFLGEKDAAVATARRGLELEKSPVMMLNLAWVLAETGQPEEARGILGDVLKGTFDEYVRPAQIGMVELAMGNAEEGYSYMEKALAERDSALLMFGSIPWFKKYRSDPRWSRIDEKLRLSGAAR